SCLLQISTRQRDFLVDTLELRGALGALNEVLTDPSVTKVLHGADSDIIWLQRDLGLYLVGLFDTGQAARVLGLPSAGLAYVLRHFCGVHADKKLQLADWRQRPLTDDMAAYARADTHYLLYVHDRLKAELAKADQTQVQRSLAVLVVAVVVVVVVVVV
ncbi:ribonuclease H-like domain-containing protein, partial [Pavlovales sp. CCMP2436]